MVSFNEILGLGYSGYAKLDSEYLLLEPSSVIDEENLFKGGGPVSTQYVSGIGGPTVKQRRKLAINLTCPMTRQSFSMALLHSMKIRNQEILPYPFPLDLRVASGEGYQSDYAYLDSVSLTSSAEHLASLQFQISAWVWQERDGAELDREGQAFNPREHEVLPGWKVCLTHSGISGETISWSLSLNNNWQYKRLAEGRGFLPQDYGPPNPRIITPGPLDATIELMTLARPGVRPASRGSAQIQISAQNGDSLWDFTFLETVREARNLESLGTANGLVLWKTTWYVISVLPVIP